VEPDIVAAVLSGRIVPLRSTAHPFLPATDGAVVSLARADSGACGFHNQHRCSLQDAGGEAMLPSACRHFPRVFLRDGRGCLVTLSHFCPTAAAMLLDPAPVQVVDAAPPLALEDPVEGLDARDALPPLVRPGMLADLEGYAAWEAAVVRALLDAPDAETALAAIERGTEVVRQWSPKRGRLADAVALAFSADRDRVAAPAPMSCGFALVKGLTGPHPLMAIPEGFDDDWARLRDQAAGPLRDPIARYLAACAFGNWVASRGQGLRSIAAWLRACHDVLRVQLVTHLRDLHEHIAPAAVIEPVRMADYIMVHTVDSLAFGRAAVAVER
jgi:hypothetical protein